MGMGTIVEIDTDEQTMDDFADPAFAQQQEEL